jgi:iron-sulfur cluster assembly protein
VSLVLTISPAASEAIKGLITAAELPEDAGIRISGHPEAPNTQLAVSLAPEAAEDDQVVEEEGANVFVDNEVVPLLDDKTLDAEAQGEQVEFRIVEGGRGPAEEAS